MFTLRLAPVVLFLSLLPSVVLSAQNTHKDTSIDDNSDWWSIIRENANEETIKPETKDVGESNFKILGITVGEDELSAIQTKLGKAAVITRGDAGSGRSQICYQSEDGKTHLIFENGEVQYAFYLLTGGEKWTGINLCAKSKIVSSGVSTLSGIHLGQSPGEIEIILGKPTKSLPTGDRIYFRQIRKRNTPAELKKLRQSHADISDQEFHQNYDFYDLTAYIVARFSNSKLIYLGVSKAETD